ncbi:hypothetical protein Tco_1427887 [Tanacetum coccineum]
MDQESAHMVATSKVPMLKLVTKNGNAPLITKVVKGVETTIAPTTAEEKTQIHKTLEIMVKVYLMNYVNRNFLRSLLPEWNTHTIVWRNNPEIDTLSMDDLYNNLKIYELEEILEETTGRKFFCDGTRLLGLIRLRRVVPVETTTSNALVSCDGSGYDWSDQAEEGVTNFALMAYSSTSSYSSSSCLESVEARLLIYKKNESVYEEDIKVLKCKIHLREVAIIELRRKLELAQKQKDKIQLTVENFENLSKSLSKLIDCQIVDKCKTGLGYNVVPPPYTIKFLPPKPNFSFTGLEEFTNKTIVIKPVVENSEAKASEAKPKVVRKNNGA